MSMCLLAHTWRCQVRHCRNREKALDSLKPLPQARNALSHQVVFFVKQVGFPRWSDMVIHNTGKRQAHTHTHTHTPGSGRANFGKEVRATCSKNKSCLHLVIKSLMIIAMGSTPSLVFSSLVRLPDTFSFLFFLFIYFDFCFRQRHTCVYRKVLPRFSYS